MNKYFELGIKCAQWQAPVYAGLGGAGLGAGLGYLLGDGQGAAIGAGLGGALGAGAGYGYNAYNKTPNLAEQLKKTVAKQQEMINRGRVYPEGVEQLRQAVAKQQEMINRGMPPAVE